MLWPIETSKARKLINSLRNCEKMIKTLSKNIIKQEEKQQKWKNTMKLNLITQINIESLFPGC